MRRWLVLGCLFGMLAGRPAEALAQQAPKSDPNRTVCPICAHASDDAASYSSKAGHMLMRGTVNTFLGWTEMIRCPAQEAKAGGNVFAGIVNGVGSSVKRTVEGAAEVLTFWTPKIHRNYLHFAHDCPICANK